MNVVWVGPGWYRRLSFAVGDCKVVQVSQNKAAQIEDSFWCETITQCREQFSEKVLRPGKREVY